MVCSEQSDTQNGVCLGGDVCGGVEGGLGALFGIVFFKSPNRCLCCCGSV